MQINACIAAVIAAGGGVCDASSLGGIQMMSQQVRVGSPESVSTGVGLTLILPDTAVWSWTLADSASCGIDQFGSTTVRGNQPGGSGDAMMLTAGAGAQMDSIYCTDGMAGTGSVRADGFSVWNTQPGRDLRNGVVHLRTIADQSSFSNIYAENDYGDAWHIDSACCGTTFQRVQGASGSGNGAAGGTPLTLGSGAVHSVSFHNSSFNQPGPGHANISITGGAAVMGVNFYSTTLQGNGATDSSSPMVLIGPGTGPVHFFGGVADTQQSTAQGTKPVFENHGVLLDVDSFEALNTTLGVNDVTAGRKTMVWSFNGSQGSIPAYRTVPGTP